jgi:PTH1 family peptidyl-tRNA hydrolase
MKLIIGLGNPGKEYERTRHNVGFQLVDVLCEKWDFPDFAPEKKFSSLISAGVKDGEKILLVKPETFMNRSGEAVASIISFFKLTPADITVVHDDLDLPFGSWKESTDSGPAGHNGVASIIEHLGTKTFRRIRIGIGRPSDGREAADYVLGRFGDEEQKKLPELFEEIFAAL